MFRGSRIALKFVVLGGKLTSRRELSVTGRAGSKSDYGREFHAKTLQIGGNTINVMHSKAKPHGKDKGGRERGGDKDHKGGKPSPRDENPADDDNVVRRVSRLTEYVDRTIKREPTNFIRSKKTDAVGALETKVVELAEQCKTEPVRGKVVRQDDLTLFEPDKLKPSGAAVSFAKIMCAISRASKISLPNLSAPNSLTKPLLSITCRTCGETADRTRAQFFFFKS